MGGRVTEVFEECMMPQGVSSSPRLLEGVGDRSVPAGSLLYWAR